MRGTYAPETKTITFDLVSISNLKSAMMGTCITRCTVYRQRSFQDDLDIPPKKQKDAFYGRCDVRPDEVGSERFVFRRAKLRRVMDRNSGSWAAALQRAGRRNSLPLCL